MYPTGRPASTKRCSICGINYPPDVPFNQCAVCDGALSPMYETAYHIDWERRVQGLLHKTDPPEEDPYPNAKAKLRKHRRSKTMWIKKSDLLAAGYRNLQTFQVVKINDRYYEIQGFDSKKQEFWIEEIKETLDEEELYSQLQ